MTDRENRPPILYEDAAVVVAYKAAGLLSTPAEKGSAPDLLSLLSEALGCRIYPVHRLDRPTGGVMVYAKTARAAAFLSEKGEMKKEYLAVCEGVPEAPAATLEDLLFFDRARDKTFVVTRMRRGVKEARLSYELLQALPPPDAGQTNQSLPCVRGGVTAGDGGVDPSRPTAGNANAPQTAFSLLRVTLDTGRTHQIRAQLASRHLPLYGDRRYGAQTNGTLGLFAARLCFVHPTSGKAVTFEAPPPSEAPFSFFTGKHS